MRADRCDTADRGHADFPGQAGLFCASETSGPRRDPWLSVGAGIPEWPEGRLDGRYGALSSSGRFHVLYNTAQPAAVLVAGASEEKLKALLEKWCK